MCHCLKDTHREALMERSIDIKVKPLVKGFHVVNESPEDKDILQVIFLYQAKNPLHLRPLTGKFELYLVCMFYNFTCNFNHERVIFYGEKSSSRTNYKIIPLPICCMIIRNICPIIDC